MWVSFLWNLGEFSWFLLITIVLQVGKLGSWYKLDLIYRKN